MPLDLLSSSLTGTTSPLASSAKAADDTVPADTFPPVAVMGCMREVPRMWACVTQQHKSVGKWTPAHCRSHDRFPDCYNK